MIVLHLVKTSEGADWALREMRELVKQGVEVHVAMPLGGRLTDQYREANIVVHPINYDLVHVCKTCKNIRRIVEEVNPDIVQSHFVATTFLMRIALRKDTRPRIFKVPGPLHLENAMFRRLDLLTSQKCDYWVGSCSWTVDRYKKSKVSPDRLYMSFYGGDGFFNKCSDKKNVIRNELSLGEDAFVVGMVAYIYAPKKYLGQRRGLKGHEDFIDAIAIVAEHYPFVHGVCVGGAWNGAVGYEKQVKDYAQKKTKNVHFLGTRRDVIDLYNDMQLVVHPSHSENLGGSIESLSYRVPTIATNVGGFPDSIIHGKTGLLVPPKAPEVLAQTIIDCIDGKYNLSEFVENGYAHVKSGAFDVSNTSKEMYRIYEDVLSKMNRL